MAAVVVVTVVQKEGLIDEEVTKWEMAIKEV